MQNSRRVEDLQIWPWVFLVLILSPQDSFFKLIAHWDSKNPCQNEEKTPVLYLGINKAQPASWMK